MAPRGASWPSTVSPADNLNWLLLVFFSFFCGQPCDHCVLIKAARTNPCYYKNNAVRYPSTSMGEKIVTLLSLLDPLYEYARDFVFFVCLLSYVCFFAAHGRCCCTAAAFTRSAVYDTVVHVYHRVKKSDFASKSARSCRCLSKWHHLAKKTMDTLSL